MCVVSLLCLSVVCVVLCCIVLCVVPCGVCVVLCCIVLCVVLCAATRGKSKDPAAPPLSSEHTGTELQIFVFCFPSIFFNLLNYTK